MADLLVGVDTLDDCERLYRQAIELDPRQPTHSIDLGVLHALRAAAETDPDRADGHWVNARREYVRAWGLATDNPEMYAFNGWGYVAQGHEVDTCVASLEKAHALLPSHPGIHLMLAQAHLAAGRPTEAIGHLRTLLVWAHENDAPAIRALLAQAGAPVQDQDSDGVDRVDPCRIDGHHRASSCARVRPSASESGSNAGRTASAPRVGR